MWSLYFPSWFFGMLLHPFSNGLVALAPVVGLAALVAALARERPGVGRVGGVLGSLAVSQLFVFVARLLGGGFGYAATGVAVAGFAIAQGAILPAVLRRRRGPVSSVALLTVFAASCAAAAAYAAALAFIGIQAWE